MGVRWRRALCRAFGHKKRWAVTNPARPLDFTIGCPRCLDPSTFVTLTVVDDDPSHPGFVKVRGMDKLAGWLEGQV